MARRFDDQMMLIDRASVCDELRKIADTLGMTHAELLRAVVADALPGLRSRSAATKRERTRRTRSTTASVATQEFVTAA